MIAIFIAINCCFASNPNSLSTSFSDDPQPDTIFYHDNQGGYWLFGVENIWVSVRFTPISDFELRCAYIKVTNPNNIRRRGVVCVVTTDTTGMPSSTVLTQTLTPVPPDNIWMFIPFPDTIVIPANHEFHIALGPAPAGTTPITGGWYPQLDVSPTGTRNYFATGLHPHTITWFPCSFGDFMISAGGEYLAPDAEGDMNESAILGYSEKNIPSDFTLNQNYPNPFNAVTTIDFTLPEASGAQLVVYNSKGEMVVTLAEGFRPAGYYSIKFDGEALSSGVYWYVLTVGGYSELRKMLLLK
jgi:hypothetical protein